MTSITNGDKLLLVECGYWFVADPHGRILWDSRSATKAEAWDKAIAAAGRSKFKLLWAGVRVRQATAEDVLRPQAQRSTG